MSNTNFHIEELLLDYLEGKLDPSKKAFVERYLAQNPEVSEELSNLNDIKLYADEKIVYDNKASLKRTKERGLPFILKFSVAATGALLIGMALWLNMKNNSNHETLASVSAQHRVLPDERSVIKTKENTEIKSIQSSSAAEMNQAVANIQRTSSAYQKSENKALFIKEADQKLDANAHIQEEQIADIDVKMNNRPEDLAPLSIARITKVNSTDLHYQPVIVYEQELVYVFEDQNKLRDKIRTFLPQNVAYIEKEVTETLKEVRIVPISERIKNAFQINKLKEALVPSSIQETLTTL